METRREYPMTTLLTHDQGAKLIAAADSRGVTVSSLIYGLLADATDQFTQFDVSEANVGKLRHVRRHGLLNGSLRRQRESEEAHVG